MTTLIELHDRNIRISSPDGVLLESPGFANTASNPPVYGEEALKLTRLHPQQSFSQFWLQLSLDPLVHKNKLFRHQADLAYAHLNTLMQELNLEGEAVFAVPSHYNASQLATLLGLAKHCPLEPAGLVDISLLALSSLQEHQQAVFIDIQLYQTVLTRVSREQGEIVREKVIPIPGTGLLALHDCWSNAITDAFIKQSRFDPQHNADTEQYIYNELENWLQKVSLNQEILLEINNKGTVHQASLTLKNFEQRAQNIYKRISQELSALVDENTPVYVLDRFATLPGLSQELPGLIGVNDERIGESAYHNLDLIRSSGEALRLIARLPVHETPQKTRSSENREARPSHFLYRHRAYALPDLNLPALKLADPIKVSLQEQGYCLHNNPRLDLQLNGAPLTESVILKLGDSLTVNQDATIEFIQVR